MSAERVLAISREAIDIKERFFRENASGIAELATRAAATLRAGGKLLLFGNGGSAADAQHIAAELVGRFKRDRAPLAAIALTTDTSALTAIGNDFGFEHVFDKQLRALGRSGDMAIALSTSGGSPNVVRAAVSARELGLQVAGFLGGDGGALRPLCDPALVVPHRFSARVQEVHITMGHILCELVEDELAQA